VPVEAPADVIVSRGGPAGLLEQLRAARFAGDVHLLGGVRTIQAFRDLGAIDRYELQVLPILLGDGLPLFPRARPGCRFASTGTARSRTARSSWRTCRPDPGGARLRAHRKRRKEPG
jgi:dihydrofolate reductase